MRRFRKLESDRLCLCLFLLCWFSYFTSYIGKLNYSSAMPATILLFALIMASMMEVNTIFVNLLPLKYEKLGRVSTVSGFLNSVAYMGTAVSAFTIG